MANYKDPKHKQSEQDDALSALYQASKKPDDAKMGNQGDDPHIPEEIDMRILQAAKDAVSPALNKVSFIRRRWDIPVSVAATIMLATLLFINVKDEIPLPVNEYLPKPSFDSPVLQVKESERVKSPPLKMADPSRTGELSVQRVNTPESTSSPLIEKDADFTGLPASTSEENLSKQEAEKLITTLSAEKASSVKKQVGEAQKSVHEEAGLSTSQSNLLNRAAPSPPRILSSGNFKDKSNMHQAPTGQNPSNSSDQSIVRSDLTDETRPSLKPSNQEQWLKDIEQLLEENKEEAANLSLDKFRSTYPEYRLDAFCSLHKRLTCQ